VQNEHWKDHYLTDDALTERELKSACRLFLAGDAARSWRKTKPGSARWSALPAQPPGAADEKKSEGRYELD